MEDSDILRLAAVERSSSSREDFSFNNTTSDREWVRELLKEEEEKGDPHVLIFLQEYEALYHKVTASYSHTIKLQTLVRRLKADLVCTAAEAGVVASIYNTSEEMIASMKKEVIAAYNQMVEAKDVEDVTRKRLNKLMADKRRLEHVLRTMDADAPQELMQKFQNRTLKANAVAALRDQHVQEVERVRLQLNNSTQEATKLSYTFAEHEAQKVEMKATVDRLNEQVDKEEEKRKSVLGQLEEARSQAGVCATAINNLRQHLVLVSDDCDSTQEVTKETKSAGRKVSVLLSEYALRVHTMQLNLDAQLALVRQREQEIQTLQTDYTIRLKDLSAVKELNDRLKIRCTAIQQRMRISADLMNTVLTSKQQYKTEISILQQELDGRKFKTSAVAKDQLQLLKENDSIRKTLMKAKAIMHKDYLMRTINKVTNNRLRQENDRYRSEFQAQVGNGMRFQTEGDKYDGYVAKLTVKILRLTDNERKAVEDSFDIMQVIVEQETRVMELGNLTEVARTEHALYCRSILYLQGLIAKLKEKALGHLLEIQKLVLERDYRDQCLVQGDLDIHKLARQISLLKEHLGEKKRSNASLRNTVENEDAEERKLVKIKAALDVEYIREHKALMQVVQECDTLNVSLIRRHYELQDLYEKVRLKQSLLVKCENIHNLRCKEKQEMSQELHRKIARLRVHHRYLEVVEKLRAAISHIRDVIMHVKLRTKRLTDVLSFPRNIHRWRNLKSRDPSTFEMLQEITTINKQMFSKTNKMKATSEKIHELDTEYIRNQIMVLAQPSPESVLQLKQYKEDLESRLLHVKVYQVRWLLTALADSQKTLTATLNEALEEKKYFQSRYQVLEKAILHVKKEWLQTKKKEWIREAKQNVTADADTVIGQPSQEKVWSHRLSTINPLTSEFEDEKTERTHLPSPM